MDGTIGLAHLSPRIFNAGINGQSPEADNHAMDIREDFLKAFLFLVQ